MKKQSVTLLEAAIPAQLTALLNTTALFTNVCFFILRPESDPGFTLFLRQWDPWDDVSHTAPDFTAFGSNSCVLNSAGFKGGPIIQPICKEIELKKGILLYEHDVHLPQILAGCLNPHKQQWANPRGCLWHVWPGSSNSSGGLESPFPPVCESLAFAKQNVRHKPIQLLTGTVSTCSIHHLCKVVFLSFPPYSSLDQLRSKHLTKSP